MTEMYIYLFELNLALVILYTAFKLFFEKDRNFKARRFFLLGIICIPLLIPLIPVQTRSLFGGVLPFALNLEAVTVTGNGISGISGSSLTPGMAAGILYLVILGLGLIKLGFQLGIILKQAQEARTLEWRGLSLRTSSALHASSFFGLIFMDPAKMDEDSFAHIVEHEHTHKREWHSVDRIVVELFVLVNWFNPVAWLFRRSVIGNLEYLADSAVLKGGADPHKYQLSILNQYIGSASLSNSFSSQIKNRITMLNKNYRMGSSWKVFLFVPLTVLVMLAVSCTDKDNGGLAGIPGPDPGETEYQIYKEVDEMPAFQGGEPVEFRRYITQNLLYPTEAKENKVSGKVIVQFVVRMDGKVEIPDISEVPPSKDGMEGNEMGEVVVVSYRPVNNDAPAPDEKYVEMLKAEAVRVITSSPPWEPGKENGKAVDVLFTFPINFVLQ